MHEDEHPEPDELESCSYLMLGLATSLVTFSKMCLL